MVDRVEYAANTPVFNPGSSTELENSWRAALKRPAFVSLNIMAEYDAEDPMQVNVKVNGAKSKEEICSNPTITVLLVEDNIQARSQSNGGPDFVHQHVNRAINTTWGAPVEFDGDEYVYEYTFKLAPNWKQEDMQIVAFIANYNANDPNDCEIKNASNLLFSAIHGSGSAGIQTVESEREAEFFTLSGIKVNPANLTPGIYVKKTGNKAEKIIVSSN